MLQKLQQLPIHQKLGFTAIALACLTFGTLGLWWNAIAKSSQQRLAENHHRHIQFIRASLSEQALSLAQRSAAFESSSIFELPASNISGTRISRATSAHRSAAAMDGLWVVNSDLEVIGSSYGDPALDEAVRSSLREHAQADTPRANKSRSFFLKSAIGPVLASYHPVTMNGERRRHFIVGVLAWDRSRLDGLQQSAGSKLYVRPANGNIDEGKFVPLLGPSGKAEYDLMVEPNWMSGASTESLLADGMKIAAAMYVLSCLALAFLYFRWVSRPLQIVADVLEGNSRRSQVDLKEYGREFGMLSRIIEERSSQSEELRIINALLEDRVVARTKDLEKACDETIEGWSRAMEIRDHETEGHCRRVTDMTMLLASSYDFTQVELENIRRGALLHDIGKIGVPDSILLKPGKLDAAERAIIEQHTVLAYQMLSPIQFLRDALDIPTYHHEKWDGTGYPMGLEGENIPLSARIFALADVWDALRSDRPYRAAWSEEKVRRYIEEQRGVHFDPQVVDVYLSLTQEQIEAVRQSHPQSCEVLHLSNVSRAA